MAMSKRVLGRDVGKGYRYLAGSTVDQLIHSEGVAITGGGLTHIYCSGKTATFDEAENQEEKDTIVGVGDIYEQTRQVLRNIQAVLGRAGATIDDIVRVRVYVRTPITPERMGRIHEARAEFFHRDHYPASTLVGVADLARPDALVEIDVDAVLPAGRPTTQAREPSG